MATERLLRLRALEALRLSEPTQTGLTLVRESGLKVVQGFAGFDVGDRVRVKLINVNVERGFIDFVGVS